MIRFDKIEVVNQLKKDSVIPTLRNYTANYDRIWIYDKIHHEINQYCSKNTLEDIYIKKFESLDENLITALQEDCEQWAPGIDIISIRITKPVIPVEIKDSYIQVEELKVKSQVESSSFDRKVQQARTEKNKALAEAEKELELRLVQKSQELKSKEA